MSKFHLSTVAGAALLAAMATTASAQQAKVYHEAENDDAIVEPFGLTVDQIEDMDIVNAAGDEIGEVEEVLVDENGQAVAVVVESGGFLGIGDRESIVMLDQLGLQGDQLVTTLSKEELESAPEWND
ncbi:MAG: PRC-barrel domain-containing protein [Geminicoccaceae bacterium]|nr:PRC-barrel domain-containing protein [Geminicoccaceae bacterium]